MISYSFAFKSNSFRFEKHASLIPDTSTISKALIKNKESILHLIILPIDTTQIQFINTGLDLKKLQYTVRDEKQPMLARFLAILVIKGNHTSLQIFKAETLTRILVTAFKNNFTGYYSDWGFKGNYSGPSFGGTRRFIDQDLGVAGSAFQWFGEHAVPELTTLLKDTTSIIYNVYVNKSKFQEINYNSSDIYIFNKVNDFTKGSESETLELHPREQLWSTLRIKDFAALYISTIKSYNLKFDNDVKARDIAIEEMKTKLGLNE